MSGLLEGWSAASSTSNDVAGGDVPRQPPGFKLADAAISTIDEQNAERMQAQYESQHADWVSASSYPPPVPTPNTGADSTYADIPEQR